MNLFACLVWLFRFHVPAGRVCERRCLLSCARLECNLGCMPRSGVYVRFRCFCCQRYRFERVPGLECVSAPFSAVWVSSNVFRRSWCLPAPSSAVFRLPVVRPAYGSFLLAIPYGIAGSPRRFCQVVPGVGAIPVPGILLCQGFLVLCFSSVASLSAKVCCSVAVTIRI